MPPERTSVPRQEPVSCQLCRQRKLKCSRHYPCSNCQARGVSCVYKTLDSAVQQTPIASPSTLSDVLTENVEIKSRLTKLERLIEGRLAPGSDKHITGPAPPLRYTKHVPPKPIAGPKIQIVELEGLVKCFSDTENPSSCIPFPTRDKGLKLLEQYTCLLHGMMPIVHCPTVKDKLEGIYANATQPFGSINTADIALILAIFSSVAFYCHVDVGAHSCFPSNTEALLVACKWAKISIDSTWPPRDDLTPIEGLQVIMMYYFLVHHMEGLSPLVRLMHNSTVAIARDLGLHKTDMTERQNLTRQEIIDQEISRRVWWHLCGTDWQLAQLPGPTEGTYLVNPRHHKVKLPRNITDEDLLTQDANFARPPTEPTPMAYFLQRIRIGEISRTIVDTCFDGPYAPPPWEQDYQMVLFTDGLYEKLLNDLPPFLAFDEDGKSQTTAMDAKYPYVGLIRQITNIMVYTRRLKLHMPYIGLSTQTEQYAHSGRVCLQSAKRILQMQETLKSTPLTDPASSMRMTSILRHLLHGLVLMIMGLRNNVEHEGGPPIRGPRPHNPINDAEQVLDGVKQHIKSADTFLDSLKALLATHEAQLSPPDPLPAGGFPVGQQDPTLTPDSTQWAEADLGMNLANFEFDIAWDQFLS
ncbi:hypothetical protein K461DRAFT_52557 [Myriangium duriaei CBS 260.36]|uniref:Zn(2)-C6 fungal-type domain-containing protein n=1 Tax=Myriangium duriaei CBS 260.36 TaxID=1168546 RepID=A0A9P4IVT3_9PEZI|nr:hypothetical protein K461DRAFT_52557 [Myriangium duriaei CBS 260.36]